MQNHSQYHTIFLLLKETQLKNTVRLHVCVCVCVCGALNAMPCAIARVNLVIAHARALV
jgi:hypothetical protein